MSEQLGLQEAPPSAPSAWDSVRAAHPDKPLVRVIDLARDDQAFVTFKDAHDPYAFPPAGATVYMPSTPGGRTWAEIDAITAEFDRRWQQPDHGTRR